LALHRPLQSSRKRRDERGAYEWVPRVSERVVLGCGLDVPDISSVTGELTGFESLGDVLGVADSTSRGVDQPGTYQAQRERRGKEADQYEVEISRHRQRTRRQTNPF
jgi:hypothetical protein